MKYGLNLLLWTSVVDESHYPLLEKIKGWGYDGVEIPVFEKNLDSYRKLGKKLEELDLECTAVTVCSDDANPISPDPAIRAAAVSHIKQVIDLSAAAGAQVLCGPVHSALGTFSGRGRTEDEWNWAKDTLSQIGDHAQQQNVQIAVEYLNRFEAYFLNSAEDTARFCREINHPSIKMMYDTFHANIEEKCPLKAVDACKDQLVHVHISENDRSTPGEGQINWDASFEALRKANYDGWMTIEAFGLALPELAAATRIWRKMFPTEEHLAVNGLQFMKSRWEGTQQR